MSVENNISSITDALRGQDKLQTVLRARQDSMAANQQPAAETGSSIPGPFEIQLKTLARMTPEEVLATKKGAGVAYLGQRRR